MIASVFFCFFLANLKFNSEMGRLKCVRRESGLPPKKQDTPLKTKLSRNDSKKQTHSSFSIHWVMYVSIKGS